MRMLVGGLLVLGLGALMFLVEGDPERESSGLEAPDLGKAPDLEKIPVIKSVSTTPPINSPKSKKRIAGSSKGAKRPGIRPPAETATVQKGRKTQILPDHRRSKALRPDQVRASLQPTGKWVEVKPRALKPIITDCRRPCGDKDDGHILVTGFNLKTENDSVAVSGDLAAGAYDRGTPALYVE